MVRVMLALILYLLRNRQRNAVFEFIRLALVQPIIAQPWIVAINSRRMTSSVADSVYRLAEVAVVASVGILMKRHSNRSPTSQVVLITRQPAPMSCRMSLT